VFLENTTAQCSNSVNPKVALNADRIATNARLTKPLRDTRFDKPAAEDARATPCFARIFYTAARLVRQRRRGFGSSALMAKGASSVMLTHGRLVVKLARPKRFELLTPRFVV
jgi:hypothetical protein